MKELWKDIKGYEGLYQVSNLGRVKSLEREEYVYNYKTHCKIKRVRKEKIIKIHKQQNGYFRCCLCKNSIKKYYWIHRLVAQAFIPNSNSLPEVNHKDEKPINNCVNNLEWCTVKYNCNYGTGIQRQVEKRKKKFVQYDLAGNLIKIWDGLCDIEYELGIPRANIYKCCKNQRHHANHFKWKYYDEIEGGI